MNEEEEPRVDEIRLVAQKIESQPKSSLCNSV